MFSPQLEEKAAANTDVGQEPARTGFLPRVRHGRTLVAVHFRLIDGDLSTPGGTPPSRGGEEDHA